MKRGFGNRVIKIMLEGNLFDRTTFSRKDRFKNLLDIFQAEGYITAEMPKDEEHNLYAAEISTGRSEHNEKYILSWSVFESPEFRNLAKLYKEVQSIPAPPFIIINDGTELLAESREKLINQFLAVSREGVQIQRYKGLGEMNPEQLWDTTMDPDRRKLLKVQLEDEVKEDEIFTILMGDEIETRKQFILDNALSVSNLDI
jgi:DNA gyrase subunit B